MESTARGPGVRSPGEMVAFLLDERGVVRQCTPTVSGLLGRSAAELEGRPLGELSATPAGFAEWVGDGRPREFGAVLRHRGGHLVEVDAAVLPLPAAATAGFLVVAAPAPARSPRTQGEAVADALLARGWVGLAVLDAGADESRLRGNPAFFGLPEPAPGGPPGASLSDVFADEDAAAIEGSLREVLRTGEPLVESEHPVRRQGTGGPRRLSVSAFRLDGGGGYPGGVAAVFTDVTARYADRRQLTLLHAAASRLGRSLDVVRNAEELSAVLVPEFADLASVDLTDPVLRHGESAELQEGTSLRRVAVATALGPWPADLYQLGDTMRTRDLESRALRAGGTVVVPDTAALRGRLPLDSERMRLMFPASATSAVFVPLFARGHVLGVLSAWRGPHREPYTSADVPLIEEVASRAALGIDNARRYGRERDSVEALQRSLLPPALTHTSTAETGGIYVPAHAPAGTGGSWYDVIRLSGVRVAFVAGRVTGHGVSAAAATGRLRSAVQVLADLDLQPDELLTHLDDLVTRVGEEGPPEGASLAGSLQDATCLYAAYDPVDGECRLASAGHPAPFLARRRDGAVSEVAVEPGPALGRGPQPFHALTLVLDPGDVLALHSGPLRAAAPGAAPDRQQLLDGARTAAVTNTPLSGVTRQLDHRLGQHPRPEDLAVLLTRVDRIPSRRTAHWQLPADLEQVARARALTATTLTRWGLDDLAFTTELIVSELVTNAIRYAGGPVGLRLINDRNLVCEVSDPSQAQPHLRRARLSDEGGRGLFLVARCTHRWGSRYTDDGKTLWAEQTREPPP